LLPRPPVDLGALRVDDTQRRAEGGARVKGWGSQEYARTRAAAIATNF
jgi:hypothetical protein